MDPISSEDAGPAEQRAARRRPDLMRLAVVLWLGWLLVPVYGLLRAEPAGLRLALVVAGLACFAGLYLRVMLTCMASRGRELVPSLGVMAVIAFGLWTLAGEPLAILPMYVSVAAAATLSPLPRGLAAVLAVTLAAALIVALGGTWTRLEVVAVLLAGGLGLSFLAWTQILRTITTLRQARESLARLAVAEERLRMSRDLHDLLGHSLSLITLKSELAGRTLRTDPEGARREVADVEERARSALDEVRAVITASRRPSLDSECRSAEAMLRAAGIVASVEMPPVVLAEPVDSVLAWAVREGVTNVVRHSGARHCKISVLVGSEEIGVLVADDGSGPADGFAPTAGAAPGPDVPAPARPRATGQGLAGQELAGQELTGHGLTGLRERVETCRGRLEAYRRDGGGFTLQVWLPARAHAPQPGEGDPRTPAGEGALAPSRTGAGLPSWAATALTGRQLL